MLTGIRSIFNIRFFTSRVNSRNEYIHVFDLGSTDYRSTWDLQKRLFQLRVDKRIPDLLLLNEHGHVYTLGKNGDDNHLLAGSDEIQRCGAEVFHIDRGGGITYHGPGQLVGYPILDLEQYYLDVHRYLRDLEEVILRALVEFGIHGRREKDYTGIWVGEDKIAAIGVKVSRWVTMHGFALNVNTDLSYFHRIIPCGIFHRGVTSLQQLLHKEIEISEVASLIVGKFGEVFGVQPLYSSDSIGRFIEDSQIEKNECPR
jgi:lipoyl(octanoyl) transferase